MSYIAFRDQHWSFKAIKELRYEPFYSAESFERSILDLANSWLTGQSIFSLHTSGSTGEPEKWDFNREQIQISVDQTVHTFQLKSKQYLFNPLSVDYVAGFMMVMRSLIVDMPLYCSQPGRHPFLPEWQNVSFGLSAFVPLQMQSLLANKDSGDWLKNHETVIVGGGPVPAPLEENLQGFPTNVYHTYGMTETLTHVAIRQLAPDQKTNYEALKGVTLDKDENDCLIIQSPIWEAPIYTKDRVRLIDNHHFQWLGRWDWVINSGGYKVQVEKVEQTIEKVFRDHRESTSAFFLAGIPDNQLGEKLVLLVEEEKAMKSDEKTFWLKTLSNYLHPYEVPKNILTVSRFCYTHTGKLDRKATLSAVLTDGTG